MHPNPKSPAAILSVFALALIVLGSCSKEKYPTGLDPDPDPVKTNPPAGDTATGTLYGRVLDEAGLRLIGAVVTAGSSADTTDSNGVFAIKAAKYPKGRAVIMAKKAGYYDGARAQVPGSGSMTRFELRLMKKTFSYNVDGKDGGKVPVSEGGSVTFASGAFVTASGAAYTGNVKMAARYLNPDSSGFYEYFAGDNQGWGADAQYAALVSLGVMRVDIQGASGEALKLADAKPATLTYPVPKSQEGPDSIPLWYYDPEIGQWREEGSAKLKDGVYTGTVSHFSDWNIDYKGSATWEFTVVVVCDSVPIEGVKVRTSQTIGISDRDGRLRYINAPADIPTNKVEILASDNNGLYFTNGPKYVEVNKNSLDSNILIIELDSPCPGSLRGAIVDCKGDSVEAFISLKGPNGTLFDYTLDGNFRFYVQDSSAQVLSAADVSNNRLTPPLAVPGLKPNEQRNIGSQKICGPLTGNWTDLRHDSLDFVQEWGMSPDGSLLAGAANRSGLLLFDTRTGAMLQEIPGKDGRGGNVYFSLDNKRMLTSIHPRAYAEVFDITVKPAVSLVKIQGLTHAEISDDGKTVFGAGGAGAASKLALYSAETGAEIKAFHPTQFAAPEDMAGVHTIHLIPEHDAFAYIAEGGQGLIRVWSLSRDTLIHEIKTGINASIFGSYTMDWSDDGRFLWIAAGFKTFTAYDLVNADTLGAFDPAIGGTDYNGLGGTLTEDYWFHLGELSGVEVIQQFNYHDSSLIATLSVPAVPEFNRRVAFPKVSRNQKILGVEVRFPSEYPKTSTGFRVYRLE